MKKGINPYRVGLPTLFCCLLLLAGQVAVSQPLTHHQLAEELHQKPEKMFGYFLNYPTSGFHQTAPPKGFKPFYLSHYGRHGARRTHQEALYDVVLAELNSAHEKGNLTTHGEDVRKRVQIAYDEAQGLWGELTPLGIAQHKEIARRMVSNYPQIFRKKGVTVNAVSSNVRRCIMSMAASTSQLLVMNPSMELSLSTGDRFMDYIAYDSPEWHSFDADTSIWHRKLAEFERKTILPERLLSSLFLSSEQVTDPIQFAISLRWIVTNTNALDLGVDFDDIFEEKELQAIWETVNYKFYTLYGPNPDNGGIPKMDACRLLSEMLSDAEEHLSSFETGASLRYGHDVYIMKLMNLLLAEDSGSLTTRPEEAALVWQDYQLTPMAANVQFVFFKNRKNDILVKLLLNEEETALPIKTDVFPFYPWSDFREYCNQLIERWGTRQ